MAEIPEKTLKEAAELAERQVRVSEALRSNDPALNLEQLRADYDGDGPTLAEMILRSFGDRRRRRSWFTRWLR